MFRLSGVLALLVTVSALPSPYGPEPIYEPKPYSFNYESLDDGGSHSHSQSSDGRTVTGSYQLSDADGRNRIVDYVADEMGFRATVKTNEPGTQNASPADVDMQANPMDIAETPIKYSKPTPIHIDQPAYRYVQPRPAVRMMEAPRPIQYMRPRMIGGLDSSRYAMVPYDQSGYYGYRH